MQIVRYSWLLALFIAACKPAAVVEVDPFPVRVEKSHLIFTSGDPQLKALAVQPVKERDTVVLHLTGKLVWNEDVTTNVFSPLAGRVASIKGARGQKVNVGDELARITSPDFGQAQADAAKSEADLALAKRVLERTRDLLKQGVLPQKELDSAENAFRDAQSERDRAVERLAVWGGRGGYVDGAFALKAPMGGVIVDRNVQPGQEVRSDAMLAGMAVVAAPMFVISDPESLWVHVDVSEQDLSNLQIGQKLEIRSRAYGDKVFPGVLTVIGQSLNPDTRTVVAKGTVSNPEKLLKAQMYVNVNIITHVPKMPQVPIKSVFLREGKACVFVRVSESDFEMRQVTTDAEDAGQVFVSKGLKADEVVVSEGALVLESLLDANTSTANAGAEKAEH
ncbi:efflux RND transporter periplasmic adaptor subunit [Prosthecobacter vanneervenii]|uniref:Cobalt-zinc-cadmium efflux system membrane fusion protein n=1 Tax=Prosthecobacter vanneervenii TaxID=48466 RepID=A0A7W7YE57_9BACT|nr:efflux RND transporter periplasmic adaptor subunit [Prosthecobacter vanneervenii]MBB5034434.1 cobalt-zinc-cadmium efflux system membrane fusion protein [Prosthecobacter vanneervenii]